MAGPLYKFGDFDLDCDRFQLRRNGRVLKLERIPLELLILLVERDGSVVPRQEMVDRLWGKDVFVDTEHGVNTAIRKIRAALSEDADNPRYIQTVQGKGYRFAVESGNGSRVSTSSGIVDFAQQVATPPEPPEPALVPVVVATKSKRGWMALSAALLLCLAAGVGGRNAGGIRDRMFGGNGAPMIHSIAVLPLLNLSGDPGQEYFADGMTDELITALAKNRALRVVSRTSVMQYKGVRRPVREIASELGVDGILEGSLSRSSNRVHITVQLVHGPSDTHIWAESYDRDLNGLSALPEELSQTVAKEVKLAVSEIPPSVRIKPEAHDAYLHGRYLWFADRPEAAQTYFEKAIGIEPEYAAAWAGLADSYSVRAVDGTCPSKDVMAQSEAAARKAVALDDSLSDAHKSLAAWYFFFGWDWKRAEAESARAVSLNPQDSETHHLRAYILMAMNRPEESLQEQKRSTELDPFARPWALGFVLIRLRQFDAAIADLRLREQASPGDIYVHYILSEAYHFAGRSKEAAEEIEKAVRLDKGSKDGAAVHEAFTHGGEKAVDDWLWNHDTVQARTHWVPPLNLADENAHLERQADTLKYLEAAYREHSTGLVFLQNEPIYDFLHSDERYRALVKRIGLPLA